MTIHKSSNKVNRDNMRFKSPPSCAQHMPVLHMDVPWIDSLLVSKCPLRLSPSLASMFVLVLQLEKLPSLKGKEKKNTHIYICIGLGEEG